MGHHQCWYLSPVKLLKHIVTDDDNETFDTTRTLFVCSVGVAIGLTLFTVLARDVSFDIKDFGIGLGAITAAFGISKRMEQSNSGDDK